MKKKLIVFIFAYKFKKQYIRRFDLNDISKQKYFDVECHQLIDFIYPKFKKAFKRNDTHKSLKKFKTYLAWKMRIKHLREKYKNNIILVNTVKSVCNKSFRINNFLNKTDIKLLELEDNFSSIYADEKSLFSSFKYLILNLFFNIKKIARYIETNFYTNLKKIINKPRRFILNSGKNNKYLFNKNIIKIEGNFPDFNMHLATRKKRLKKYSQEKFALFLEAATPLSEGDRYISNDDKDVWGDPKIWFKNLNSFFDFVEKQLKVQIKIAPHPKIKHKNLRPHYYSGRKIIRHDLAEIAKYSKFFISRSSSAMCYAVIYNKPAIFITNNKIMNGPKFRFQKSYSSKFGKDPINIDKNLDLNNLKSNFIINKKKYRKFKINYLSVRNDNKRNFEIISKLI